MTYAAPTRSTSQTMVQVSAIRLSRAWYGGALCVAFMLGAFVRLLPALIADFPLNDGGLFFGMAQELKATHYALPDATAYNAAHIPFAYPPLSFYIAAALSGLTGSPLIDVLRWLPPLVSVLLIPAFFLLARDLLEARFLIVLSTFLFALLPRSFEWLIMGGGLTRSFGALFALLTLHYVYRLYTTAQARYVLPVTVLASLTVLSHLAVAWFTFYSAVLFFVCWGRSRRTLAYSLGVAAGVLVLTAPWALTIIHRHGFSTFMNAFQSGQVASPVIGFVRLLANLLFLTGEPFVDVLLLLGYVGLIIAIYEKRWLYPAWLVLILAFSQREAPTDAMAPFAILCALAIDHLLLPALYQSLAVQRRNRRGYRLARLLLLAGLLIYGFVSALGASLSSQAVLKPLSDEERQAMAWIAQTTPPDSRFVIVTQASTWEQDRAAEWFPILAERRSLNTVQGFEWLSNAAYEQQMTQYAEIHKCLAKNVDCLDALSLHYTHLYVTNDGSPSLLQVALEADSRFTVLYSRPHVAIFVRQE